MFATLSDRLAETFKNLRGKGRLSEADIDATAREIRIALLEADVALPVVKEFVDAVKERARGEEVSQALNPAQQVVKIVNDELVDDPRRRDPPAALREDRADRDHAGRPPGRRQDDAGRQARAVAQGAGQAARCWSPPTSSAPTPSTSSRSTASGPASPVFAPEPGNGVGDPVAVARGSIDEAKRTLHDVVIVDTAGRLGVDAEMMQQAADIRDAVSPDEILFVVDAMIGQDAVNTAQAFLDGVGYDGVVLTKLDGDARGGAALSIASITGKPVMFASDGEKLTDFDVFHPDRMASPDPRHGRHAHPDRAGREDLRRRAGRQGGRQAHRPGRRLHPRRLPRSRCSRSARWARCRRSWGCCPGWGSSASSSRTSTSARSTGSRRSSSR